MQNNVTQLKVGLKERLDKETISVKFCMEVKEWLRHKMEKKYCQKF